MTNWHNACCVAVQEPMAQTPHSSEMTRGASQPSGTAPESSCASAEPELRVEAAGFTDVGHVRDRNEDAFLIATLQRSLVVHDASPGARGWFRGEPAGTLLIVADGMGGQGGGDVASSVAVNTVTKHLLNVMPWVRLGSSRARSSQLGLRDELSDAVLAGDERVRAEGARTVAPNMGTTLTLALLVPPLLYIAHVGDTRCYLLEHGELRCLTTDHNLAEKYAAESLQPVEPPVQLQHILWNALGAGIDQPVPDVCKVPISPGAVVLLCSDGLNKHVPDQEIAAILAESGSPASRAARLVERANEAGGTDNITALVATVLSATEPEHQS